MSRKLVISYLRTHRKRSGLTQLEVARLVGYKRHDSVADHEMGKLPPSAIGLAYASIFKTSLSDLFPQINLVIAQEIENRIQKMEKELQQRSAKGRGALAIARKLEWIEERRNEM